MFCEVARVLLCAMMFWVVARVLLCVMMFWVVARVIMCVAEYSGWLLGCYYVL